MEYYDEVVEIKRKPKLESRTKSEDSVKGGVLNAVKNPPELIDDSERTTTKRPSSSLPRKSGIQNTADPLSSESDSSDTDSDDNAKISAEGFDYKQWENVNAPGDIKELYQYIAR